MSRKSPKPSKLRVFWREWVLPLALLITLCSGFRSAVADWNDVPTGSMIPTILEGDRIFVNKLAYDLKVPFTTWRLWRWSKPDYGQIVVFYSPADERRMVKRVIGVPGDLVELRQNRLWINGQAAHYDPTFTGDARFAIHQESLAGQTHPVRRSLAPTISDTLTPFVVPAGHYFVMGDNRDDSFDSRWFGLVAQDRIVGQATAVALSFDPERWFAPRWERWFTGLP